MANSEALILIGILAMLDILTTVAALKNPRLREANGILAGLMRRGPLWIVVKLAVTAGAIWLLRDQENPVNVWLSWAVVALYAAVVLNNARLAR